MRPIHHVRVRVLPGDRTQLQRLNRPAHHQIARSTKHRARSRNCTRDPRFTKPLLYWLSYTGKTRTQAPAFRDLSRRVIGRFASIRFCPFVEELNPTHSLSSPRRELNSSLRFTKPMHDLRAARAIWSRRGDSNPRSSRWQRDALPLSHTCKKVPSRVSNAELKTARRLIVATAIARDCRPGSRCPLFLVGVTRIALATSWSKTTRSAG